jgi:tripartite-type tricarboxylate transporter receptor subunit TctC
MQNWRESIARLCALGALALAMAAAVAQTYPSKPVTVIVPQAPGGANDTVARIVLARLSENLGQQFIVENRPGAGGNIGTQAAAKAAHDGYTLLLTVGSSHTINPALYRKVPFDPIKDFEPISLVATAPYILVVNPAVPAKSVKELIAVIKSRKEPMNYASAGNGTLNHLLGEMFKTAVGVDLVHVPYKAAAASVTDVVNGQVPIAFASLPSVTPFIKAERLRVLAVASPKRTPLMPDLPTIGETVPGFGAISWYGLLAPAGTPKEIIAKLNAEVGKVLASRELIEKMGAQGGEANPSTPEQFAALIRDELPVWAAIVKASNAQVD